MQKGRRADFDLALDIDSAAGFMSLTFQHLVTESTLNVAVIKSCAKHRHMMASRKC